MLELPEEHQESWPYKYLRERYNELRQRIIKTLEGDEAFDEERPKSKDEELLNDTNEHTQDNLSSEEFGQTEDILELYDEQESLKKAANENALEMAGLLSRIDSLENRLATQNQDGESSCHDTDSPRSCNFSTYLNTH